MAWTATLEGSGSPEEEQAVLNSLAVIVQGVGATGGFWTTNGPHVNLASYDVPSEPVEDKKAKAKK